jgi:hypothetical protein
MQHFQAAVASEKVGIFKPFHFSFGWNVVVAIGIVVESNTLLLIAIDVATGNKIERSNLWRAPSEASRQNI